MPDFRGLFPVLIAGKFIEWSERKPSRKLSSESGRLAKGVDYAVRFGPFTKAVAFPVRDIGLKCREDTSRAQIGP